MLPNNDLVKDPRRLQFFLLADVIFVILLISIIIRQIVLILVRRRKSYDESRLYIKFVNLFAAMALGPAIGLVIITSLFFNLELRTWYGDAVRDAVVNSNIVAKNYENEIQAEIVSDTQLIMREILKVSQNNEVNIQSIRVALSEFINLRTISSIYIFNTEGNIYLSLKDPDNKNFSVPSNEIFKIVNQNRVYIFQLNKNSITAYKKINFLNDVYMQVNRNLNTNIWDHISATKEAFEIYTMKEEESSGIQITYSMIFVLFSICFILVAILIGFNLASNLSKPITNLIKSANKISEGNFDAKVSEADQFQEIKVLLSSYNKMISEIENKQNELISKSNNKPKLVIGFSAETNNLHSNSKQKLQNKGCDWIIANDVSKNDIGFDSDFNEVSIFYKDKNVEDEIISKTYKSVVADEIVKRVINQLNLI